MRTRMSKKMRQWKTALKNFCDQWFGLQTVVQTKILHANLLYSK